MDTIPLYVRAGAVKPHYLEPLQHLKGEPVSELGLDLFAGDAHSALAFQEGQRVELTYHFTEKTRQVDAAYGAVIRLNAFRSGEERSIHLAASIRYAATTG